MRHNPASGAIVIMLRQLKMHGMAQAIGELTEQGSPAFEAAIPILSQLLKAETAEREVRSTAYQLKIARFAAYRDLNGFDFSSSASIPSWLCRGGVDAQRVALPGWPSHRFAFDGASARRLAGRGFSAGSLEFPREKWNPVFP